MEHSQNSAVLLPVIGFLILANLPETLILSFNLREALMVCYRGSCSVVSVNSLLLLANYGICKRFFLKKNPSGLLNGVFKSYGDLR